MVTNIHILSINTKDLPKDLRKTLVKRAADVANHAESIHLLFPESPINEIMSLKNLGISYRYAHRTYIQLSLF